MVEESTIQNCFLSEVKTAIPKKSGHAHWTDLARGRGSGRPIQTISKSS